MRGTLRTAAMLRTLLRAAGPAQLIARCTSTAAQHVELEAAGPAAWLANAATAGGGGSGGTQASLTQASLTQRYQSLVAAGTLKHDAGQLHAVQRLDRLGRELKLYSTKVAEYQRCLLAYQERRAALREPLVEAEAARLAAEEASAAAAAARRQGGMLGWLGAALGAPEPQAPPQRSEHQRRVLARAAVERRLDAELGPPPAAPPAPKGVYLHGSVGSGKSLVMDLLSAAVHAEQAVTHHRRLHFNAALLELHSRMHALESHRVSREQRQMESYAAAVLEQQQRDREGGAAAGGEGGDSGMDSGAEGGSSAWRDILRLDPVAQKLRRSKLARIAFRRMMRDKASRSEQEHEAALAAANAAIVQHAARALIRDCDTVQLASDEAHSRSGHCTHGHSTHRHSALLCFDEMQISDPFSALALKGLFEALVAEGAVVVATSNRAPHELDKHGINEHMWDHFMLTLKDSLDVVSLDSETDYRRLAAAQAPLAPLPPTTTPAEAEVAAQGLPGSASYFFPLGLTADAAMERQWRSATGGRGAGTAGSAELPVLFGRTLHVERACGGVAWFEFAELCARPLGAADYLAVAQAFHTVFISGVPAMDMQVRDQARRFIVLLDELYNHRCRLVCSAAAAPDGLFAGADSSEPIIDLESLQFESAVEGSRLRRDLMADGGVAPVAASAEEAAAAHRRLGGAEEQFAFARACSRLHEMQTDLYLASRPRAG